MVYLYPQNPQFIYNGNLCKWGYPISNGINSLSLEVLQSNFNTCLYQTTCCVFFRNNWTELEEEIVDLGFIWLRTEMSVNSGKWI